LHVGYRAATFRVERIGGIDVGLLTGLALVGISLFMLLGFVNADLAVSGLATALALLVGVGIPGTAGAAILMKHFRGGKRLESRREQLRLQTLEAELLRMAGEHGGRLTVVEVVRELAMTHSDAEALLKSTVQHGVAEIEISDDGLLVYRFPDVQLLEGKSTSKGVLDA